MRTSLRAALAVACGAATVCAHAEGTGGAAVSHHLVTYVVFGLVIASTLLITWLASRGNRTAGDFYTAGGGIGPATYAAAVAMVALLAVAMIGLFARAIATSQFTAALFLVGISLWFVWTIGGFIKRNRPRKYSFDQLPDALLP